MIRKRLREIGDPRPGQVLEDEKTAAAVRVVDARDLDPRVLAEGGVNARRGLRLAREVELEANELGELVGKGAQVDAPVEPANDPDASSQGAEVDGKDALGFRVLDLHHHGLAAQEAGAVNLGEGGRGNRLGCDLGEDSPNRLPELLLDMPAQRRERAGRDAVVQVRQRRDERAGEDGGAGGVPYRTQRWCRARMRARWNGRGCRYAGAA